MWLKMESSHLLRIRGSYLLQPLKDSVSCHKKYLLNLKYLQNDGGIVCFLLVLSHLI